MAKTLLLAATEGTNVLSPAGSWGELKEFSRALGKPVLPQNNTGLGWGRFETFFKSFDRQPESKLLDFLWKPHIVKTTNLHHIPSVLREIARPVNDLTTVEALYERFMETLHESGGVGLAAPQVGIPLRFFAIHYEPGEDDETPRMPLTFLINPEVVKRSETSESWREGCLSLPGYTGVTTRSKEIKVRGLNRFGKQVTVKASGLYACAIQHELDHLDGILFTDHAQDVKLETPEAAAEDSVIE